MGHKRGVSTNKKENVFQEEVLKYLRKKGGHWIKIHVSACQSQGEPDIVGCYMGMFVAFELKVKDNTTSKLQDNKLSRITSNGGFACAPRTLEEIEKVLNEIQRVQSQSKSD